MRYELCREIFNSCSGNQMRDVFFSFVETDDTDAFISERYTEEHSVIEKTVKDDGSIIYELVTDGLRERYGFTPDE